ncbi:LacI family DNA-binding transcriptional regulator [Streptomyces sp. AHA2]|uniref:LacI family DNA-binding transcriptional regulator n=1 Tax=Streptomyces sp. AHA2 TaxID=3064526 RepID=UPI002FE29FCD
MARKAKTVTLATVAEAAGVSLATASKALNGKTVVSAATRQRVEETARALGFVPNHFAKALNSPTTGVIGLLTGDLSNRFVLPILSGVENTLGVESTSIILTDARRDPIRERHQISTLLGRKVDGIIVVGHSDDERPSLAELLPVSATYAFAPSASTADASYLSDNYEGARLAIDHLVEGGRRSIAVITGDPTYSAAKERLDGAVRAARRHGLEIVGPANAYGDWSEEWGRYAAVSLLEGPVEFDAVFCANDQIARGVADELRDHGREVPRDVAIVGFDNWELYCAHSRPPITTIDMNLEEVGRLAALGLVAAIAGEPPSGITRVAPRLVPRASTAGSKP